MRDFSLKLKLHAGAELYRHIAAPLLSPTPVASGQSVRTAAVVTGIPFHRP